MMKHVGEWELTKVALEIERHGENYTVSRDILNEYQERTGGTEEVITVKGLFHTAKGYLTKTVGDGNITHTKGSPMVLTKYADSTEIQTNDIIAINGLKCRVTGKNNIEQYGILCDISLEEVIE